MPPTKSPLNPAFPSGPGPTTDGILGTLGVVGAGLCFCFLPSYTRRIKPATVEIRPLDLDPQPEIDLLVAFRKDDPNPALACFLSLLRQKLGHPDGSGNPLANGSH